MIVPSVALARFVCCGEPTTDTLVEPALFFHGGYGEARLTERTTCRCGVVLAESVSSVRPDYLLEIVA